ncbi:MAG TPA: Fic family protein [Paludibacteraceae bacterium]|nr:Fic family protein [Paludibacteraceae bacterium]HPH63672.1 Fic family protein [Paludibacteraceae bacterium]
MYTPPFTITSKILNLVAEISAQIERYAIRLEQSDGLRLRKANRIKTIHSSLAIEGNTLSEEEVHDIIDGKNVVAPIKQIQEVKNAIDTYELYSELNPFEVKDLLRAHGVMMKAIVDDAGCFRHGGVGVFGEHGLVHLAPPADRVSYLMNDLFQWLRTTNDHLLIRSCVFHYEFEFIHPFSDGNGRTGRLWQSLLLGHLHPLFEHLPVENMVYSNQQAYYDAIGKSTHQATSTPFIEFMLDELLKTLKEHQGTPIMIGMDQRESVDEEFEAKFGAEFGIKFGVRFGVNEKRTLLIISENPLATSALIASEIGISQRAVEKQIKKFRDLGIIHRVGSDKAGHWTINYK